MQSEEISKRTAEEEEEDLRNFENSPRFLGRTFVEIDFIDWPLTWRRIAAHVCLWNVILISFCSQFRRSLRENFGTVDTATYSSNDRRI